MQLEIMVSLIAGMSVLIGFVLLILMVVILVTAIFGRGSVSYPWLIYTTMAFLWMIGGVLLQMKFGYQI